MHDTSIWYSPLWLVLLYKRWSTSAWTCTTNPLSSQQVMTLKAIRKSIARMKPCCHMKITIDMRSERGHQHHTKSGGMNQCRRSKRSGRWRALSIHWRFRTGPLPLYYLRPALLHCVSVDYWEGWWCTSMQMWTNVYRVTTVPPASFPNLFSNYYILTSKICPWVATGETNSQHR